MVSQHAKSFTSLGDIMLVDLQYYQRSRRRAASRRPRRCTCTSTPTRRPSATTFRVDGQPKLAARSAGQGQQHLSPFVQLAPADPQR
jgi:hypothetical protein